MKVQGKCAIALGSVVLAGVLAIDQRPLRFYYENGDHWEEVPCRRTSFLISWPTCSAEPSSRTGSAWHRAHQEFSGTDTKPTHRKQGDR